MLTDEQIDDLVHSDAQAFAIFLRGFGSGYSEGLAAARLSNEQAAELAARRFYAMEVNEAEIRQGLKTTIGFIDVARNRANSPIGPVRKAA